MCQDIVLKAIAIGPLNRNVTIKGGVVMQSLSKNKRRATRDIDLDFIHYSLEDDSIRAFIKKLDCIPGVKLDVIGDIEELKHQDYHGKSIKVRITDDLGTSVESKIDIGVHKHLELEQRNTQQSMNEAVYAMKMLQKGMAGEAEKQGLVTEDAIEKLVKEVRMEV